MARLEHNFQYSDSYVQFLAFLKIGFKIPYRMVQDREIQIKRIADYNDDNFFLSLCGIIILHVKTLFYKQREM